MVFLPPYQRFRDHQKNQFDGKVEYSGPPLILGPSDCLKKYEYDKIESYRGYF